MEIFLLLGLVLIVISFFVIYFSFKKLKGTARIVCMVIGYILLFIAGIGCYLGVAVS